MIHWRIALSTIGMGLALVGLPAMTGCRTPPPVYSAAEVQSVPDESVLLAPGDTLSVKFFYSSDLNEEQVIRPDGRIALQLVGEVKAAGLTPEQLQAELTRLYTPKLEKPEVAVIVKEFQSRKIYVGGAVSEPGSFDMTPSVTALDAVIQAGGFVDGIAQFKQVVVIRRENNRYAGYGIDFQNTLEGGADKPFYLKSGDIVFVPKRRIAHMNTWVEQYITKMIPSIGLPVFFQVN